MAKGRRNYVVRPLRLDNVTPKDEGAWPSFAIRKPKLRILSSLQTIDLIKACGGTENARELVDREAATLPRYMPIAKQLGVEPLNTPSGIKYAVRNIGGPSLASAITREISQLYSAAGMQLDPEHDSQPVMPLARSDSLEEACDMMHTLADILPEELVLSSVQWL